MLYSNLTLEGDTTMLAQVHAIRKEYVILKSQFCLTRQRIGELEAALKEARSYKEMCQKRMIELEIEEKRLLDQIKVIPTGVSAKDKRVRVVEVTALKSYLAGLSPEEKLQMAKELLNG